MTTKKTTKKTTKIDPKTPMEKNVARWAQSHSADYDNGLEGVFKDLFYGGCQSGMVGHLIYYKDTLAFYRKHRREIQDMLQELLDECGTDPAGLFGEKWDKSDIFARETNNQNLLAWFGFEEAARHLCDRAGIED